MGDLGERRLQPLPVRVGADPQFEAAIGGEPGAGLLVARHHRDAPAGIDRGAVRGLLAIDREAEADPAPVRLPGLLAGAQSRDVDGREHPGQRLRVVAAVEMLVRDVVEGHPLRAHEVFLTHDPGFEAGLGRDGVEDEFEGEADARAGDPAIGQDRAFVRRHRPGAAAIGREIVGAGQDAGHLRGLQAGRERVGRVGAGIDGRLAIDAAQAPVALGIGRDAVMVLAAIGVGGEVLAPVLEPAHRVAAAERQPAEADLLGEQDRLVAEAAPDIGRDDADAALLDPQAFREAVAHDVRHLARGVDHELVEAVIEMDDRAAPLDRRHALAAGGDRARDPDRGVEGGPDVHVDEGFQEDVVPPMLVHEGGARRAGRQHVVDGRQLLEVENDRGRDVLGLGPARGEAEGHELAHLPDLAGGQDRLLRDLEAGQARDRPDRLDAVEIGRGEDAVAVGLRHVDRPDAGMGEGAAHEGDVLQAGQAEVADILAAPAHQAVVLLAGQARADALGEDAVRRNRVAHREAPSRRSRAARTRRPSGRRNALRIEKWSAPATGSRAPGACAALRSAWRLRASWTRAGNSPLP
ncbi:hypothetical protein AEGHOMDF_0369 [Methylobacterium soli]|nr:hypothetical protein AEGHOMDF_0369 [Methylobacterium soli]